MVKSQKNIFYLAIFLQTLFAFSLRSEAYINNSAYNLKNQKQAMNYMNEAPVDLITWLDPTAYYGLSATALSYLSRSIEPKLYSSGYKDMYIQNEDGRVTRVLIKMEGSINDKRPFVVFVAGISSKATAEYFQLFALPLNKYFGYSVALIENPTAVTWTVRNKSLLASGYEAGWDLYQKLKVLKADEKVAPYVSEMHVVGLSLGGSDVSFMAYFDSVLRKDDKSKGIVDGAIVNWSSPVNRYQAYIDLKKMSGISAMITDGIFRLAYNGAEKVYEKYTDKSFYWIFWEGSLEESLTEVQMKASNEYLASHNDFLKYLPFKKEGEFNRFEIKEYLKLFRLEYFLPHIKIPMMWIHSTNDPIVSIDTVDSFISKNRSGIFDIYSKNYGGHIGQAHSYGGVWVVETMVRYFQYWGNFKASYYTQWKRPYEKDFLYRRYLRSDSI